MRDHPVYIPSVRLFAKVLLVLLFSSLAFAGGVLDLGFGNGGIVNFRFSSESDDRATAAVLQPDGKIIVVGTTGLSGQSEGWINFGLARLNTDGTLDATFGDGGLVVTDLGEANRPASVILQPDGKIIVGGAGHDVGDVIVRYNSNGSLDTTFSTDGIVTFVGIGTRNLLLQPDGKIIVVGGRSLANNQHEAALTRYNSDGSLDTSFGTNGLHTFTFGNRRSTGVGMAALQADGKIVLAGGYSFTRFGCVPSKTQGCTEFVSFLARLNPSTSFDRKFGRRAGREFAQDPGALTLESGGSFVVNSSPGPRRYYANGRLEAIFDPPGFSIFKLVQLPDGKIAACGEYPAGWSDMGTALFDPAGRLIASERRDFFGGHDSCSAILAQPDGKIVTAGSAQIKQQGPSSFTVIRYLGITP